MTKKTAPQHEPQSELPQNSLAKRQYPEVQPIQRATRDSLQRLMAIPHTASPEAIQLVRESYGQAFVQRLLDSDNHLDNPNPIASDATVSNAPTGDLNSFLGQISANRAKLIIQPKLTVTPAGDQYEQEADAVAAQVVQQMNAPTPSPATVQRDHEDDKDKLQMKRDVRLVQRQPEEDNDKLQMMRIQRQTGDVMGGSDVDAGVESRIQAARGGGSPIPEGSRSKLENTFGADFSGVRVHTDSESDSLNRSVQARAFTTGQDIFFRQGEYNPGSPDGQKLLAHELTHVVQQRSANYGELGRLALIQRVTGADITNWADDWNNETKLVRNNVRLIGGGITGGAITNTMAVIPASAAGGKINAIGLYAKLQKLFADSRGTMSEINYAASKALKGFSVQVGAIGGVGGDIAVNYGKGGAGKTLQFKTLTTPNPAMVATKIYESGTQFNAGVEVPQLGHKKKIRIVIAEPTNPWPATAGVGMLDNLDQFRNAVEDEVNKIDRDNSLRTVDKIQIEFAHPRMMADGTAIGMVSMDVDPQNGGIVDWDLLQ